MVHGTLRVAFLHAPAAASLESAQTPGFGQALGAASVAAALIGAGLCAPSDLLALSADAYPEDQPFLARIEAFNPDIVGFSLYSWNSARLVKIAHALRERGYAGFIIAGGPDAEGLALIDDKKGIFDAIFLGEAEREFIGWIESVRNATGRKDPCGEAIRCSAPDLAKIPSPWLTGLFDLKPGASIAWELTRGCPYRCAYCYEGRGSDRLRPMPAPRLEKELEVFLEKEVAEVFVLDPTFNVQNNRALEILAFLRKKAGSRVHWNFEVRAELLNPAQVKAFAALPCFLQIGLQSSDAQVLAGIGRTLDRGKFVENCRLLDSQGVVFGLDLIYGLPGDSLGGFLKSLDFALSLAPNHLDIFGLSVLPGTELWEKREELGLDAENEPPYALRSHYSSPGRQGFSESDMAEAREIAQATDYFYSKGRAVPWFKAVVEASGMKASAWLKGFSCFEGYERQANPRHGDIEEAQIGWARTVFGQPGPKARFASLATDMIRYFGAWSRALAEGEKTILSLAYHPETIELAASAGLARLIRNPNFQRQPCKAEIGPSRKGPILRLLK
ncbi:MAG: radical SAM domain-containing protein [Spirochaetes bacterium]|nr:MAG: radical SAM domain-containing protein [Spirochaetota bacterium]